MKTKIFYLVTKITVAVILVTILVIEVKASDNPNVKVVRFASESALVNENNNDEFNSYLTIENAAGNRVYYRENMLANDFYLNNFNFNTLSDGDYKIVAENNNGINEILFNVKGRKITVTSNISVTNPYVEIKDDVLKLSLLNSSSRDVNLTVLNEDGVIYEKALGSNFSINAGFSLANLEDGEYAINITDGVNTYSYNYKK